MIIAIVGSRKFNNRDLVNQVLTKELSNINTTVITGGAPGVDQWAIEFCRKDCTPCEIIRPIDAGKKIDYLYRNIEIITKADKIIVFWDQVSRGSKFVIEYASKRSKEMIIYHEGDKVKKDGLQSCL